MTVIDFHCTGLEVREDLLDALALRLGDGRIEG
jgi:hypothetical protein